MCIYVGGDRRWAEVGVVRECPLTIVVYTFYFLLLLRPPIFLRSPLIFGSSTLLRSLRPPFLSPPHRLSHSSPHLSHPPTSLPQPTSSTPPTSSPPPPSSSPPQLLPPTLLTPLPSPCQNPVPTLHPTPTPPFPPARTTPPLPSPPNPTFGLKSAPSRSSTPSSSPQNPFLSSKT